MDEIDLLKSALLNAKRSFEEIKNRSEYKEKVLKGYGGDISRTFDLYVENSIIESLKGYVSKILTEERGIIEVGKGEIFALIDPVDGSTNVSKDLPFCATSIALFKGEKFQDIFAAGIIDLLRGDIFICDGKNVFLNGNKVKPSNVSELNEAVVSMDMKLTKLDEKVSRIIPKLLKEVRYIRFFGAIALEIAYVSAGMLDAFIVPSPRVRLLDIAAGLFMVKTTGGYMKFLNENIENINIFENKRYAVIASNNEYLASKLIKIIEEDGGI
jgi:myo-inositol-1(or 4)-monophosphatase